MLYKSYVYYLLLHPQTRPQTPIFGSVMIILGLQFHQHQNPSAVERLVYLMLRDSLSLLPFKLFFLI